MEYLSWLNDHWMVLLGVAYVLDKITKATPWPYDDFVIDVAWNALKTMLGRGQVKPEA